MNTAETIVNLRNEGKTYSEIAKSLQEKGASTPTGLRFTPNRVATTYGNWKKSAGSKKKTTSKKTPKKTPKTKKASSFAESADSFAQIVVDEPGLSSKSKVALLRAFFKGYFSVNS